MDLRTARFASQGVAYVTHEQKEVLALAAEWFDFATGSRPLPDNTYFRFIALWIAFNGLCAAQFPTARTDRAQINSFGSWGKARTAHCDALGRTEYRDAIGVLEEKGVFNYGSGTTELLTDCADIAQVITLVYRVRCNLFHARKVPANLRDRSLVEAAHVIVGELMKRLDTWRYTQSRAV
jgi:hypothetical protein